MCSGGCLGRLSSASKGSQTTTVSDNGGLAVSNGADKARTVSVTVTAAWSNEILFENSVSLETYKVEDTQDRNYKAFNDVFTDYGKYDVRASTNDGYTKTETVKYEPNSWNYWLVDINSSGIDMGGPTP